MDAASILLPPEEQDVLMSRGFRDLHDDLRRGWHLKSVLAVHRQARMAAAFAEARPVHHEALGQLTMVVDPVIYEEMRREHGVDCWRDREFRRWFANGNPQCRIRSKSRHTRVAVNGRGRGSAGARTLAPLGNPRDARGRPPGPSASTAPMLPRSAHDDRGGLDGAGATRGGIIRP